MTRGAKFLTAGLIASLVLNILTLTLVAGLDPPTNTTINRTIVGQPGPQGPMGFSGLQGMPGIGMVGERGQPGLSIIGPKGETGAKGEQGEKGDTGPAGEQGIQGEQGNDGRTTEIRKNPVNGNIERRYVGEVFWTVLLKKCEYQGTC